MPEKHLNKHYLEASRTVFLTAKKFKQFKLFFFNKLSFKWKIF